MIKGINTRRVLGATRGRLIGRQVGEALLIAVAAFILSVIVMRALSGTFVSSMISGSLDPSDNIVLIGAGAAIALVMVALAGIFSASYSTSFPPAMVLKGSFSLSAKGRSLRSVIVGFQYVVSFILIIMTLFIYCQRRYMNSFDMGFDREQIVTFYVGNSVGERRQAFEAHLKENPHVLDVTFAGNELVSNGKMGWGRMYDGERVNIDCLPVDADFIDFFGMEVVQGRGFMPSDEQKANGTFIMNQATMDAYPFMKLDTKLTGHASEPADIVGVVKDFNFKPLQYGVSPIALYVFGSDPWWPLTWAYARISPEDAAGTMDYIRQSVSEFNPQMTADYVNVRFLDEAIGNLYQKETNLNKLYPRPCLFRDPVPPQGDRAQARTRGDGRRSAEDDKQVLSDNLYSMLHRGSPFGLAHGSQMGRRLYLSVSCACMDIHSRLCSTACNHGRSGYIAELQGGIEKSSGFCQKRVGYVKNE